MQPDTMRTLAEYIHELRRRDRDRDRTGEQPAFDTTTEDDAHWDQRDRGGDGGRGKNHSR
jgi:hypothetical protein